MNVQLPVHSAHRSLSETSNVSENFAKRKDSLLRYFVWILCALHASICSHTFKCSPSYACTSARHSMAWHGMTLINDPIWHLKHQNRTHKSNNGSINTNTNTNRNNNNENTAMVRNIDCDVEHGFLVKLFIAPFFLL